MLTFVAWIALLFWLLGLPFCYVLHRFSPLKSVRRLRPYRLVVLYVCYGAYALFLFVLGHRVLEHMAAPSQLSVSPGASLLTMAETVARGPQRILWHDVDVAAGGLPVCPVAASGFIDDPYRYFFGAYEAVKMSVKQARSVRELLSLTRVLHLLYAHLLLPAKFGTAWVWRSGTSRVWWACFFRALGDLLVDIFNCRTEARVRYFWWPRDSFVEAWVFSIVQTAVATAFYANFCLHSNAIVLRSTAALRRRQQATSLSVALNAPQRRRTAAALQRASGVGMAAPPDVATGFHDGPQSFAKNEESDRSGSSLRLRNLATSMSAKDTYATTAVAVASSADVDAQAALARDASSSVAPSGSGPFDLLAPADRPSRPFSTSPAPAAQRREGGGTGESPFFHVTGGGVPLRGHSAHRNDLSQAHALPSWVVVLMTLFPFALFCAVQLTGCQLSLRYYRTHAHTAREDGVADGWDELVIYWPPMVSLVALPGLLVLLLEYAAFSRYTRQHPAYLAAIGPSTSPSPSNFLHACSSSSSRGRAAAPSGSASVCSSNSVSRACLLPTPDVHPGSRALHPNVSSAGSSSEGRSRAISLEAGLAESIPPASSSASEGAHSRQDSRSACESPTAEPVQPPSQAGNSLRQRLRGWLPSFVATDLFGAAREDARWQPGVLPRPIFLPAVLTALSHVAIALRPGSPLVWGIALLSTAGAGTYTMRCYMWPQLAWLATEYTKLCGRSAWTVFFSRKFKPFDLHQSAAEIEAEEQQENEVEPLTHVPTDGTGDVVIDLKRVRSDVPLLTVMNADVSARDLKTGHSSPLDDLVVPLDAGGDGGGDGGDGGSLEGSVKSTGPSPSSATRFWSNIAAQVKQELSQREAAAQHDNDAQAHRAVAAAVAAAAADGGTAGGYGVEDTGHTLENRVSADETPPNVLGERREFVTPPSAAVANAMLPLPGLPAGAPTSPSSFSAPGTDGGAQSVAAVDLRGSILMASPHAARAPPSPAAAPQGTPTAVSSSGNNAGVSSSFSSKLSSGAAAPARSPVASFGRRLRQSVRESFVGPGNNARGFADADAAPMDTLTQDTGDIVVVDDDGKPVVVSRTQEAEAVASAVRNDSMAAMMISSFSMRNGSVMAQNLLEEEDSFTHFLDAISTNGDNTDHLQRLLSGHGRNLVKMRDTDGRTALHHAVIGGFVRGIEFLLGLGAEPNAMDEEGDAPLHLAVNLHSSNIRASSAEVTDSTVGLLPASVTRNHSMVCDLAFGRGSSCSGAAIPSTYGSRTSAMSATSLRVRRGTPFDAATAEQQRQLSLPAAAAAAARRPVKGVIVALTDGGADANLPNRLTGLTPLHLAVLKGEIGVLNTLLRQGADALSNLSERPHHSIDHAAADGDMLLSSSELGGRDRKDDAHSGKDTFVGSSITMGLMGSASSQATRACGGGGCAGGSRPGLHWAQVHVASAGIAATLDFVKSPVLLAVELNADVAVASMLYAISWSQELERDEAEKEQQDAVAAHASAKSSATDLTTGDVRSGVTHSLQQGASSAVSDVARSSLLSLLLPRCGAHEMSLLQVALALGHASAVYAILSHLNAESRRAMQAARRPATPHTRPPSPPRAGDLGAGGQPEDATRGTAAASPRALARTVSSASLTSGSTITTLLAWRRQRRRLRRTAKLPKGMPAADDVDGARTAAGTDEEAAATPLATCASAANGDAHHARTASRLAEMARTRARVRRLKQRALAAGVVSRSAARAPRFACARELQCEHERKTVFHFVAIGDSTEALAYLLGVGFRAPDFVPADSDFSWTDNAWRTRDVHRRQPSAASSLHSSHVGTSTATKGGSDAATEDGSFDSAPPRRPGSEAASTLSAGSSLPASPALPPPGAATATTKARTHSHVSTLHHELLGEEERGAPLSLGGRQQSRRVYINSVLQLIAQRPRNHRGVLFQPHLAPSAFTAEGTRVPPSAGNGVTPTRSSGAIRRTRVPLRYGGVRGSGAVAMASAVATTAATTGMATSSHAAAKGEGGNDAAPPLAHVPNGSEEGSPFSALDFGSSVVKLRQRVPGVPIDLAHLETLENAVDAACASGELSVTETKLTQRALLVVMARLQHLHAVEQKLAGASIFSTAPITVATANDNATTLAETESPAGNSPSAPPVLDATISAGAGAAAATTTDAASPHEATADPATTAATSPPPLEPSSTVGGASTAATSFAEELRALDRDDSMTSSTVTLASTLAAIAASFADGATTITTPVAAAGASDVGAGHGRHARAGAAGTRSVFVDLHNENIVLAYIAVCLNQCDERGMTPLHYAIVNQNPNMVFILCVYGARFTFASHGTQHALSAPTPAAGSASVDVSAPIAGPPRTAGSTDHISSPLALLNATGSSDPGEMPGAAVKALAPPPPTPWAMAEGSSSAGAGVALPPPLSHCTTEGLHPEEPLTSSPIVDPALPTVLHRYAEAYYDKQTPAVQEALAVAVATENAREFVAALPPPSSPADDARKPPSPAAGDGATTKTVAATPATPASGPADSHTTSAAAITTAKLVLQQIASSDRAAREGSAHNPRTELLAPVDGEVPSPSTERGSTLLSQPTGPTAEAGVLAGERNNSSLYAASLPEEVPAFTPPAGPPGSGFLLPSADPLQPAAAAALSPHSPYSPTSPSAQHAISSSLQSPTHPPPPQQLQPSLPAEPSSPSGVRALSEVAVATPVISRSATDLPRVASGSFSQRSGQVPPPPPPTGARDMLEPHDMFLMHVVNVPAKAECLLQAAAEGMEMHAHILSGRARREARRWSARKETEATASPTSAAAARLPLDSSGDNAAGAA